MKNNLYKHLVMALACVAPVISWAQANSAYTQAASIPTLDEWGLVGLIAAVGVAAGIALRRGGNKKK